MGNCYKPSLILSRANTDIRSIAAQLKDDSDDTRSRRLYTSLSVYSKRALRAISEAAKAADPVNGGD